MFFHLNPKVSKPLMEKRRRERINHSLETLRLLMLENTHNEKLKNPKVEKAEILESVVQFLKTQNEQEKGHRGTKSGLPMEQGPTCAHQNSYNDGMRSCLLRVSHFIASKSQELEQAQEPQTYPSSPGHVHSALLPPAWRHGCAVSSASAAPSRRPPVVPRPEDRPPLWYHGAALPHSSQHHRSCVEALAPVADTGTQISF
uniref:BHLH domain-containing protein n=1 Tax=Monopterus albus TaxID=43700 RepID=A0A3Q3JA31_MONAL